MSRKGPFLLNGAWSALPDTLPGGKAPEWTCSHCGQTGNWACRVRCRCGELAKAPIVRAAIAAASKRGDGNSSKPGKQSKARVSKPSYAELVKRLESLEGNRCVDVSNDDADSDCSSAGRQAGTGKEGSAACKSNAQKARELRDEIAKYESLRDTAKDNATLKDFAETRLQLLRDPDRQAQCSMAQAQES